MYIMSLNSMYTMKNISDNVDLITNTLGVFGTFCTTGDDSKSEHSTYRHSPIYVVNVGSENTA